MRTTSQLDARTLSGIHYAISFESGSNSRYRFIFLQTNQISGHLFKVWPSFRVLHAYECRFPLFSIAFQTFHCKNTKDWGTGPKGLTCSQPTQKCSCCLERYSTVQWLCSKQATSQVCDDMSNQTMEPMSGSNWDNNLCACQHVYICAYIYVYLYNV